MNEKVAPDVGELVKELNEASEQMTGSGYSYRGGQFKEAAAALTSLSARLAEVEKELTRLRAITQGPPVQRTKDKRKAL